MTADSSHKDRPGSKGPRRVSRGPAAATPSKRATPNLDAAEGAADADLEFDPTRPLDELVDFASMLPPLELYELEPTLPKLAHPFRTIPLDELSWAGFWIVLDRP